jgi:nitrite reductase/ring-hydroxylating ferredoxin subunit
MALVSETVGRIHGFIAASIHEAPPVYGPRSSLCVVDDFIVCPTHQFHFGGEFLGHH